MSIFKFIFPSSNSGSRRGSLSGGGRTLSTSEGCVSANGSGTLLLNASAVASSSSDTHVSFNKDLMAEEEEREVMLAAAAAAAAPAADSPDIIPQGEQHNVYLFFICRKRACV